MGPGDEATVQPIVVLLLGCFTNCLYHTYADLYLICASIVFVSQGERKAFKATAAENIYATLSEVRAVVTSSFITFLKESETE